MKHPQCPVCGDWLDIGKVGDHVIYWFCSPIDDVSDDGKTMTAKKGRQLVYSNSIISNVNDPGAEEVHQLRSRTITGGIETMADPEGTFMGWFDPRPKVPTSKKIFEAIDWYRETREKTPTLVLMNAQMAEGLGFQKEVPSALLGLCHKVPENQLYVGQSDSESMRWLDLLLHMELPHP